jgi:hypothetical protein
MQGREFYVEGLQLRDEDADLQLADDVDDPCYTHRSMSTSLKYRIVSD